MYTRKPAVHARTNFMRPFAEAPAPPEWKGHVRATLMRESKKLQSFKRLTTDRKWKTMRELKADGAKGWTMAPIATTTARAQLFGLHAAVSSRYQLLGPQATDIAARGKEPGPVSKATRKRLKREEFVAAQRAKRSRKLMGTSKVHACTAEEMKVSSYDGTPRDIPTCAGTMSTSMAMKDMASKLPSNSPWVER